MQTQKLSLSIKEWLDEHRWVAVILGNVAVGGAIAVALSSPQAWRILRQAKKEFTRAQKQAFTSARWRLLQQGYIKKVRLGRRWQYELTDKGRQRLLHYTTQPQPPRPKRRRWDRKWRFLLFDYPDQQKTMRNRIRRLAKSFGFYQLQKNVWIYPHREAEQLIEYLHLLAGKGGDKLLLVTAPRFIGDHEVYKYFNLSA